MERDFCSILGRLAYRASCGNVKLAAAVFGSFSILQFFVETLFLLCFAVYAATPISIVTKVFYAFAAIIAPLIFVISILFVYTIAQDEHRWMILWLVSYSIVTIAELVFTVIAFILLNDFHEIFQFYNIAWSLAQYQAANQLLVGNSSVCAPLSSSLLPASSSSVAFAALVSQQGAQGIIAFFVIGLLIKNTLNIVMVIVGITAYYEIRDGPPRRYGVSRTISFHDPHLRTNASRVRTHSSRVRTTAVTTISRR